MRRIFVNFWEDLVQDVVSPEDIGCKSLMMKDAEHTAVSPVMLDVIINETDK